MKFDFRVLKDLDRGAVVAKKLCVFASFSKRGGATPLISSYLSALSDSGFAIVFVQATEDEPSIEAFRLIDKLCSAILVRRNVGYDFGSWKAGLDFVGKDLGRYEKLLITNDSIAGPFSDLKPCFAKMDSDPSALWGMTDCAETGVHHIQSYFVYFDRQVFKSQFFEAFWGSVRIIAEKWRIIEEFEIGLSRAAVAAGFPLRAVFEFESVKSIALSKGADFQFNGEIRKSSLNPTLFCWDILLEAGYPFIKTELLRSNRLNLTRLATWKSLISKKDSPGFRAACDYEEQHVWEIPKRTDPVAQIAILQNVLPLRLLRALKAKGTHRYRQISGGLRDLTALDVGTLVRKLAKVIGRSPLVKKWLAKDLASSARQQYFKEARAELSSFYFSGGKLRMPENSGAQITVVLILFNKAELTYRCLHSLAALTADAKFKVLIIDNASSDDTRRLLTRIEGAEIQINNTNLGFLKACNQASNLVSTKFMLFLNNDTILFPGSLTAAVECLQRECVGAVGGRIVLPNGLLQEAGNIIWNDGTCVGYARNFRMDAEEAMFRRDVDYCSGVFLMTHSELFRSMGGFDEDYFPAYYEETDYCIRLAKQGYRVVYEPRILVKHVEFGSAGDGSSAYALMTTNRKKLVAKHGDFLATRQDPAGSQLKARSVGKRKRILFLDDRAAIPSWGAGYPRANFIVQSVFGTGDYDCTIGCQEYFETNWSKVYADLPHEIEICDLSWPDLRNRFFAERLKNFDIVWVSRPTSFQKLVESVGEDALRSREFFLIYDSEAIFAERAVIEAELFGLSSFDAEKELARELSVGKYADLILSVCEADAAKWQKVSGREVSVLGFDINLKRAQTAFVARRHILFLGALHTLTSPNGDSLSWFMGEVFPYLRELLADVEVHAVGYVDPSVAQHLGRDLRGFKLIGSMRDLTPVFGNYRLMVVPTRFAAGIPQKVFDAAVHGLPTVCSPLIAQQMQWQDGRETLVGDTNDPRKFAEACAKLYQKESLWQSVSDHSFASMEKYHRTNDLRLGLNKVLTTLRQIKTTSTTQ